MKLLMPSDINFYYKSNAYIHNYIIHSYDTQVTYSTKIHMQYSLKMLKNNPEK